VCFVRVILSKYWAFAVKKALLKSTVLPTRTEIHTESHRSATASPRLRALQLESRDAPRPSAHAPRAHCRKSYVDQDVKRKG